MHNILSSGTGTGKTVKAILSAFDNSQLYEIYISENGNNGELSVCSEYYEITDLEIIKKLTRKILNPGRIITKDNICSYKVRREKRENPVKRLIIKYSRASTFMLLRNLIWNDYNWFSLEFDKWIDRIRPDYIFIVPGYVWGLIDIALYVGKKYSIPIISFVTDDYFVAPNRLLTGISGKIVNKNLIKKYKELSDMSVLHYVIGDKMAVKYNTFFSCKHIPVMNCVNIDNNIIPKPVFTSKGEIIIVYAGNCGIGRLDTILKFAEALDSISISGLSFRFDIYTPTVMDKKRKKKIEKYSRSNYKGKKKEEKLKKICLEADLLVHFESFDKKYKSLLETAVTTKIPEYLSYRRPILAIGPKYAASIDYISSHYVGKCILSDDIKLIRSKLIEIFTNKILYEKYIDNGWKLVCSKHNVESVSKSIKQQIENAVR